MNKIILTIIKKAEEEKILKVSSSTKVEQIAQSLTEIMDANKGDTQLFKALFDITAEFLSTIDEVKSDYFELGRIYKDIK